jgi:hypothetical protein
MVAACCPIGTNIGMVVAVFGKAAPAALVRLKKELKTTSLAA